MPSRTNSCCLRPDAAPESLPEMPQMWGSVVRVPLYIADTVGTNGTNADLRNSSRIPSGHKGQVSLYMSSVSSSFLPLVKPLGNFIYRVTKMIPDGSL